MSLRLNDLMTVPCFAPNDPQRRSVGQISQSGAGSLESAAHRSSGVAHIHRGDEAQSSSIDEEANS